MRFTATCSLGMLCVLVATLPAWPQQGWTPLETTTPRPWAEPSPADEPSALDYRPVGNRLPDFPVGGGMMTDSPGASYFQPRGQSWIEVDYLLWWVQGQFIPGLATDANGTLIYGRDRIGDDVRSGLRVRGGHYFDCDGVCGLMAEFWGLEGGSDRSGVAGNGLSLPFIDTDLSLPSNQSPGGCGCLNDDTGTPSSVPIDSIFTTTDSDIWSGGLYYRGRLCSQFCCCPTDCHCPSPYSRQGYRLDGIVGYRYLSLDESLIIDGVLDPPSGPIVAQDRFETENDFHGIDLGLIYERDRGRWSFEAMGRVALGINRQQLSIDGSGNQNGGIFAQYTNIGHYEHDAFTAIPQADLILAYSLTPRLRARVGYSWLLLTNVIRPGTQIDKRIDGRFLDGTPTRPLVDPLAFFPRPRFETESIWIQGISFGFDYSF